MSTPDQVKQIIAEVFRVRLEDVKNWSSFVNNLGADEEKMEEFFAALEELDIEVPDDIRRKLKTVTDAIVAVCELKNEEIPAGIIESLGQIKSFKPKPLRGRIAALFGGILGGR
jgi:acyl carrier protein